MCTLFLQKQNFVVLAKSLELCSYNNSVFYFGQCLLNCTYVVNTEFFYSSTIKIGRMNHKQPCTLQKRQVFSRALGM